MKVKKIFDWWAGGGAAPTVPYLGEERAYAAGTGPDPTIGYYAFGGGIRISDTKVLNYWRFGADHNGDFTGSIVTWLVNDGVKSAEFIIRASDGARMYTDPSAGVGNDNRVFVFWADNGNTIYRYSDDLHTVDDPNNATWSSEITVSTDHPAHFDSPGRMLKLTNGDLLKFFWTDTATRTIYCYKSTAASNGLVWTYLSTVLADSVNPSDETCPIQLPDGRVLLSIRCNTLDVIRIKISSDFGATWGATINTDVTAEGKAPIACSPYILYGITRDATTGRTKYFYCNLTSDFTTFTQGFFDVRVGRYVYGDGDYYTTDKKFVFTWAVEVNASVPGNGPTAVIQKEVSMVAIAAEPAYDPMLRNLFDYGEANNETLPTLAQRSLLNDCFVGLRSDSLLTAGSGLYNIIFTRYFDSTISAIKLRDWITPYKKATAVNTPTYGDEGYDFNGTTQYLVFDPDTISQNDFSFGCYIADNVASAGTGHSTVDMGTTSSSGGSVGTAYLLNSRDSTNSLISRINSSAAITIAGITDSRGFHHIQRTESATARVWKNGVKIFDAALISSGAIQVECTMGCMNHFDSFKDRFSTRGNGLAFWGFKMDTKEVALFTRFDTLMTGLAAL